MNRYRPLFGIEEMVFKIQQELKNPLVRMLQKLELMLCGQI